MGLPFICHFFGSGSSNARSHWTRRRRALVCVRFQLDPLRFYERSHHFLNKLLTLRLRLDGVQEECVLDEELPKILSVLGIIFVSGIPFAEMLCDCFSDSLLPQGREQGVPTASEWKSSESSGSFMTGHFQRTRRQGFDRFQSPR